VTSSRPYRSALRQEQAEATRLRIRASARKLFEAQGFGQTTVAEIATDAGVSTQTVYAVFGGKGGIVRSMLEELEQSPELEGRIGQMMSEPDPRRQLRLFASFNRQMFEAGAAMVRAMVAGRSSPDVASVAERGDQARREGTAQLAGVLAAKGALREGLRVEEAAERLWLLTSAEQYLNAIDGLGWTADAYEQWLGDLLERELLAPAGEVS
jgi:AcrR family transcriptional regulator